MEIPQEFRSLVNKLDDVNNELIGIVDDIEVDDPNVMEFYDFLLDIQNKITEFQEQQNWI